MKRTNGPGAAMRWAALLGCCLLMVAGPARALSVDDARHLLTRSGFGAAPHEIAALLPLDRTAAVDRIVAGLDDDRLVTRPPSFVLQPVQKDYLNRLGDYPPAAMLRPGTQVQPHSAAEEDRLVKTGMQEMAQLRVWWLDQMISTQHPQAERLALFWHNHFTSKYFDVLGSRMMFDQLQMLRQQGSRSFAALLDAMMRDPAMLIFLDNAVSTRQVPNENFARELLELFTLGVGHYSQEDIRQTARALAGMSVDFGGTWRFLHRPDVVDDGSKTILGQTGRWQAEDVRRILLKQTRTAEFLAEKFYREYVSLTPDAGEVQRLAGVLRDNGYAIQPLLRAMWLSDAFWSPLNRGQLVKSPVELLVGFSRTFGVSMADGELLDSYAVMLGQQLFEPPNVAGWKGGADWLDASSLTLRQSMLQKLWLAREDAVLAGQVRPGDLLVRLSGQVSQARQHVPYSVWVDGRAVARGEVRSPSDVQREGLVRPKPVWETVRIDGAKLGPRVRHVEVHFEQDQPDTALFINWVELRGKRLPALQGRTVWPSSGSCGEPGMLYCPSVVKFDMRRAQVDAATAMLQDRSQPMVNSIIEYGTTRVPLAARPAGLSPERARRPVQEAMADLEHSARRLGMPWTQPWQAVMAVPPLLASAAVQQPWQPYTFDLVYNFK